MNKISEMYEFTQLETALVAFIGTLDLKINNLIEMPVFVLNSGDSSYFYNKKYETNTEEIYLTVPRATLKIDEPTIQIDQNTNQKIRINYYFDKLCTGIFRRSALLVPIRCSLVSSNTVKSLNNFEAMMSILSLDNVFTYEFMGNTYDCNFSAVSYGFEEGQMDASGQTRNSVVNISIELNVQLLLPRVDTLEIIDGFISDSERYDIQIGMIKVNDILFDYDEAGNIISRKETYQTDVTGKRCRI